MLSGGNGNLIAQNIFRFKCQLNVKWLLETLEMHLQLIYTYGLLETDILLRFLEPSSESEKERAGYFFLGK